MEHVTSYRTYWILWVVLLLLTVSMFAAEAAPFARPVTVGIILFAMSVKVITIGAWYMHLRYETPALIISVSATTFLTAAALFFLLVPEAQHVLRVSS